MTLVAGVDSSTQSCKIVIRDAAGGAPVRRARAPHPDGTEIHPDRWWRALGEAIDAVGGLDDVAALSVGGQQHGMVVLDAEAAEYRESLAMLEQGRAARPPEEYDEDLEEEFELA